MTQTVTLLLLLAGEPTREERATLAAHAQRERIVLVAPRPTPASPYPAYRNETVLELEAELERARTLASSLDEASALEALARLEEKLKSRPELPQAAFLLAERHRMAAAVKRALPGGADEAAALARRADVLEGRRAAAFGEPAPDVEASYPTVNVRFTDLSQGDELVIDGAVSERRERSLPAGEHHVQVLRRDELAWAGFVAVAPETPELTLGVRPLLACSTEDLGGVHAGATAPAGMHGVTCPRWTVVRRRRGNLEIASCSRERCGSFVPLVASVPPARPLLPTWAALTLGGIASIGAASLVLWASGAFERERPPDQTLFVYRGPRAGD